MAVSLASTGLNAKVKAIVCTMASGQRLPVPTSEIHVYNKCTHQGILYYLVRRANKTTLKYTSK